VPCLEVDEAFAKVQQYERSDVVLGGERGGELIDGFDLGNSPADYTPDEVFGRTVLFTTTNGTKALHHARLAERVLIGAAANRRAMVDELAAAERIAILCAGTGGNVTREDILAAGAIVDELQRQASPAICDINEWAESASREWQELLTTARALGRTDEEQFAIELRDTLGGKNLLAIGYDADLDFCARLDHLTVVPELDDQEGTIRSA